MRRKSGERGQGETYSRVSNFAILYRDVEIDTDKDSFVLEINVSNGELAGERHG